MNYLKNGVNALAGALSSHQGTKLYTSDAHDAIRSIVTVGAER